jgi:hypothetical protein
MNWRVPAGMSRLCVEKFRSSGLLHALFVLNRNTSSRHALDPELIRDSLSEMESGKIANYSSGLSLTIKMLGALRMH